MSERDELVARLTDPESEFLWAARRRAAAQIERDGREIGRLTDENERLREALTPSGETKYAYIGTFSWTDWVPNENGIEQGYKRTVPWTTIKEIMAAIRARAALNGEGEA